MKKCTSDGSCRGDYYCAAGMSEVAQVVDTDYTDWGFCIMKPAEETDAGEEEGEEQGEAESDAAGDPSEGDPP